MAYLRHLLATPVLALVLALAGGCDAQGLDAESLDAESLDERFACDDLTVVAADPMGEEALLLGIDDGLAAAVLASGQPVEMEYALPDERLTVRWVEGSNVYLGHCGRDKGTPWELEERTDAVAGTLTVRLAPRPEGAPKGLVLDAELSGVVLADDEGEAQLELEIDQTELVGIPVDP